MATQGEDKSAPVSEAPYDDAQKTQSTLSSAESTTDTSLTILGGNGHVFNRHPIGFSLVDAAFLLPEVRGALEPVRPDDSDTEVHRLCA